MALGNAAQYSAEAGDSTAKTCVILTHRCSDLRLSTHPKRLAVPVEGVLVSSLERAKKFLQNKAKALALTVVPLAAIAASALPAHATNLVFNPSSGSVFFQGTNGTFSGSNASQVQLATYNGVTGVEGSGAASFLTGISGSWSVFYKMQGSVNSGAIDSPIPLFWLFNVNLDGLQPVDWDIALTLNGFGVTLTPNPDNPFGSFFGVGPHAISGNALIPTNQDTITSYEVTLSLSGFANGAHFIDINIPAGSSIDINPVGADQATPEPAAFLLVAPGLGILVLHLKRKKPAA